MSERREEIVILDEPADENTAPARLLEVIEKTGWATDGCLTPTADGRTRVRLWADQDDADGAPVPALVP